MVEKLLAEEAPNLSRPAPWETGTADQQVWKLTGLPLPEPDGSARREAGDFRDRNMTWPARPSTIDQLEFQQRNDLIEYLNRSAIERGFPLK